jgi:hypothetical protein
MSSPIDAFGLALPYACRRALVVDRSAIRRCVGFAQTWGYGSIVVVNLFAARATDPGQLCAFLDPIGPDNDQWLFGAVRGLTTIAAWGASVPHYWRHRPPAIVERLRAMPDVALFHLGLTKAGHPKHPLYLAGNTTPVRWSA